MKIKVIDGMNEKSVKRYPLSKQVSDRLEHMIEAGDYAVGSRIPTEVELMDIFEVSRNTIREAVQSLTSAGVLEVKQGDGTYVRSSNRFDANMSLKYAQVSPTDVKEARNAMEVTIAVLAAERRTDEDLHMMTKALLKRQGLSEDLKENTSADMEFHMSIARACHNRILIDLYQSIASYMESQIAVSRAETEQEADEIDRLHEELYLSIKNQDADGAKVCVKNILKI